MPKTHTALFLAVVFGGALLAPPAEAHIILISHRARLDKNLIKRGPCGQGGSARGAAVYTLRSGSTIRLVLDEFIYHTGYFRVAFDIDGDDDFADPASYFDLFTNDTVLRDNILPEHKPKDGPTLAMDIELPDVECDNCTLQIVQVMTDKPPYAVGTNDLYYNCVDIVLTKDEDVLRSAPQPSPPPPGPSADGVCSISNTAGAPNPAPWGLALLTLTFGLALSRHRPERTRLIAPQAPNLNP